MVGAILANFTDGQLGGLSSSTRCAQIPLPLTEPLSPCATILLATVTTPYPNIGDREIFKMTDKAREGKWLGGD